MSHDIGYRQGMNEILAVIIYYGLTEEETIDSLSSKEHIEPDSYFIFDKIMELGLLNLYKSNDNPKHRNDGFAEFPNLDRSNEEDVCISIRRCHFIFHRILPNVDYELYQHILKHKFEPQLFLLRLIRCLLSREFSIHDIAFVWDVLFCFNANENEELEFLNYFCVAILVSNKKLCKDYIVITNHNSSLLQILMKPLPINDLNSVIRLALSYLRSKAAEKVFVPPLAKEENNIITKFINLVVDTIGPTPVPSMKIENQPIHLQSALENINKAISIAEKCKEQ